MKVNKEAIISNYIAILGFAHRCPERNKAIALKTGQKIASLGFGIAAGNFFGTPKHAFKGAKQNQGLTLAIIEQAQHFCGHQYCDILEIVPTVSIKHNMLAELCCGAIVIGGGSGTLKLVQHFLAQKKPVVVIKNTNGVAGNKLRQTTLHRKVKRYPDLDSAIHQQIKFWAPSLQQCG